MQNENNIHKVDLGKANSSKETEVHKIDLTKPIQNEGQEGSIDPSGVESNNEVTTSAQEQEEVQQEGQVQEEQGPVLELIEDANPELTTTNDDVELQPKDDSTIEVDAKVDLAEKEPSATIPEDVKKLIDFMKDTGGDLQAYVRLNSDTSKLDTTDVLDEYYKQTKPHLSSEERSFRLEETFSYDEDVDTDKDIKKKKIALKEEAAKARNYLESQKSKYYNDIKAGDNLSVDQKEAIDFYNKYKQESEISSKTKEDNNNEFLRKTENLFNSEFKGFEFNVGDSKFRYNVKNKDEVKTNQSDLNNFINKFVDSESKLQDAAGYHKSLYAAMNPDALAKHFYEQGKADAIKQSVAQSKNINTEARQTHGETQVGGLKFKVLGDSSKDFKFKIKNKR